MIEYDAKHFFNEKTEDEILRGAVLRVNDPYLFWFQIFLNCADVHKIFGIFDRDVSAKLVFWREERATYFYVDRQRSCMGRVLYACTFGTADLDYFTKTSYTEKNPLRLYPHLTNYGIVLRE